MIRNKYKLAVIGGDARQLIAAARLGECGYDVSLYGFSDEETVFDAAVDSLCCSGSTADVHELLSNLLDGTVSDCGNVCAVPGEALEDSFALILPLPVSGDGIKVSMPLGAKAELTLPKLADMAAADGVRHICGGKLPADFVTACAQRGISVFDYYERDEFAIANAIPTAEGAIEIAMRELPITLNGSTALVIGYGRIGKVLARLLARLGVNVTASARKCADIAWILADGHKSARTEALCDTLEHSRFDMIFNTVPHTVLGEAELSRIPVGTLIVDLASKPGGVDIRAAEKHSHSVIWALSLPGKVAPVTSGRIIADTVLGYLDSCTKEG